MLHQAAKPIQSKTPLFIRKENGEVVLLGQKNKTEARGKIEIEGVRRLWKLVYKVYD